MRLIRSKMRAYACHPRLNQGPDTQMADPDDVRKALGIPPGMSLKEASKKQEEVACLWCNSLLVKTRMWHKFCNGKCRKDYYNFMKSHQEVR